MEKKVEMLLAKIADWDLYRKVMLNIPESSLMIYLHINEMKYFQENLHFGIHIKTNSFS